MCHWLDERHLGRRDVDVLGRGGSNGVELRRGRAEREQREWRGREWLPVQRARGRDPVLRRCGLQGRGRDEHEHEHEHDEHEHDDELEHEHDDEHELEHEHDDEHDDEHERDGELVQFWVGAVCW